MPVQHHVDPVWHRRQRIAKRHHHETFRVASVLASRSKRATRSGSCAIASGSTLMATCRPRFGSVARYTSPMPPAPIWPVISYGPSRVPGANDTVTR
jgi:hypothetical protein